MYISDGPALATKNQLHQLVSRFGVEFPVPFDVLRKKMSRIALLAGTEFVLISHNGVLPENPHDWVYYTHWRINAWGRGTGGIQPVVRERLRNDWKGRLLLRRIL